MVVIQIDIIVLPEKSKRPCYASDALYDLFPTTLPQEVTLTIPARSKPSRSACILSNGFVVVDSSVR